MSAALVQQSLEIVDPDLKKVSEGKKVKNVFSLMPKSQKCVKKIIRRGHSEKIGLLANAKKLSLTEVKKTLKSKDIILKENLKKIEDIQKVSAIDLDKEATEKIIERAVTRRPIKPKRKPKKLQKTAFTEEDFKKFEEEYNG